MVAEPIETALLVHELEGCESVRARRLKIEGRLAVLPLNESAFGESAAAMAVDCSSSRADWATSLRLLPTLHSTVPEAQWQKKHSHRPYRMSWTRNH
jgi:hypothetical protein